MLKIDWTEKFVLVASFGVVSFFALALFAALKLGTFNVPTCITDMKPFQTGSVQGHYDPSTSRERYEVKLVAKMWAFDPAVVEIPAGAEVDLYLTSADVTHGFLIEGTNVNLMAVPGTVNYAHIVFDKPGDYSFLCHEYCGVGHQAMAAKFVVLPKGSSYRPRVESVASTAAASDLRAQAGKALVEKNGCFACHSTDGSPLLAPSFKGLFGRTETLADGSTLKVDDGYLKESILEPQAKMVKGFQPLMPKLNLSPADADEIIHYLKTL